MQENANLIIGILLCVGIITLAFFIYILILSGHCCKIINCTSCLLNLMSLIPTSFIVVAILIATGTIKIPDTMKDKVHIP